MLDHHPAVHWPDEFEFGIALPSGRNWNGAQEFLDYLSVDRMFLASGLPLPAATPNTTPDDIARQLLAGHQHHAETHGKQVLGVTVHHHFLRVLELWPNARFIHLLRDPRDVAVSAVGMGWSGNAYDGANYWLSAEREWERLRGHLDANQWIEIRFEQLLVEPDQELTRLCEFLGIPFDRSMYRYSENSTYPPLQPEAGQRWKRSMPPRDRRLVEARCGELLRQRGYECEEPMPAPVGALQHFLLTLQHRIRRAQRQMKRLGPGLWTQHVISQRVGTKSWRRRVRVAVNEIDAKALR